MLLSEWTPLDSGRYQATLPGLTKELNHNRAACSCPATSDDDGDGVLDSAGDHDGSEYVLVDDVFYRWAPSLEDLESGRFHIDYGDGVITIADDPEGRVVELTLARRALSSSWPASCPARRYNFPASCSSPWCC